MKANDDDISEESRHELALDVLKHAARRELAADVLEQAEEELRCFHGATGKIERELYLDAYRWLTVDECSSPFSFRNVCQLLDLAPGKVRQQLIGDSSLAGVRYWTQRCARAARRLRTSVTQILLSERNANASISIRHAEAET
jgi:hypothetical protein